MCFCLRDSHREISGASQAGPWLLAPPWSQGQAPWRGEAGLLLPSLQEGANHQHLPLVETPGQRGEKQSFKCKGPQRTGSRGWRLWAGKPGLVAGELLLLVQGGGCGLRVGSWK